MKLRMKFRGKNDLDELLKSETFVLGKLKPEDKRVENTALMFNFVVLLKTSYTIHSVWYES